MTNSNTKSSSSLPRHPAHDLLARYKAILGAAWTHCGELAGPRRLADEAAFLPAALSLQDTPVHPAPRRFAFGIIALFTIALVWSIVGKVDIVAIAPGRIIVSERTKLIQPLEASVVKRVLVKDGDTVQAGQVLVELAPTMASAEKLSVQEQLNASRSEMVLTAALLHRLMPPEMLSKANPLHLGLESAVLSFAFARITFCRISLALAVQMSGLGSSLWASSLSDLNPLNFFSE